MTDQPARVTPGENAKPACCRGAPPTWAPSRRTRSPPTRHYVAGLCRRREALEDQEAAQ
jgi:hypothetical protein